MNAAYNWPKWQSGRPVFCERQRRRSLCGQSNYSSYNRRREVWSARCKNALQLLNELKPGLEYRLVNQTGPCHQPLFTVSVQLNGQIFEGSGTTKQRAKTVAAERALRCAFIQFRDVESIDRVLRRRVARDASRDDVISSERDVIIDYSSDELPRKQTEQSTAGDDDGVVVSLFNHPSNTTPPASDSE